MSEDIDTYEWPKKRYERVIFCADEKARKKFFRCVAKNLQRTPKRPKRQGGVAPRVKAALNEENLKLQAESANNGMK